MDKPYKTSDRGKAALMFVRGMTFLGCIQSGEAGRLFFVFTDSEDRDKYEEEWTSGKDLVSASTYMRAIRTLTRRLLEPVG